MAAIEEEAGEVCADEAGSAGDEDALSLRASRGIGHGDREATALTLAGAWH